MSTTDDIPGRLSWRDPDGFVVRINERILRAVAPAKSRQTRDLLASDWVGRLIGDGALPKTTVANNLPATLHSKGNWFWLEHKPLSFPCYPHEITALQLYDSGVLTLKVAIEAARHGWTLKDASAWNVIHSEGRACFVDVLSFDRPERPGNWLAYGQFARHFLLPLLLFRKLGITPPEIFLIYRDGVTPEHAQRLLGLSSMTSLAALELIFLPNLLSAAGSKKIAADSMRVSKSHSDGVGMRLILNTLRRLEGVLEGLRPDPTQSRSVWKAYEEERSHYSESDISAKQLFVRNHLDGCSTVLDLGCNAGEFSFIAADRKTSVVAADGDHAALSRLYSRVRGQTVSIMPVVLSIGRPTPAVGWRNVEIASFLERSTGRFDCILMLGLLHHLIVGERMTLEMLVELLDRLGPKRVILEWVDPADQKFRQLAGLNRSLYSNLSADVFEEAMRGSFTLVTKLMLPCATRMMYLWER